MGADPFRGVNLVLQSVQKYGFVTVVAIVLVSLLIWERVITEQQILAELRHITAQHQAIIDNQRVIQIKLDLLISRIR